jgi:hypothetical protein
MARGIDVVTPHPAPNAGQGIEVLVARDHLFDSQVRPGHGAEQILGAGDVVAARADEVVVHHQNMCLTDRLEFPHDIRQGSLPVAGPVEGRHAIRTGQRVSHSRPATLNRTRDFAVRATANASLDLGPTAYPSARA